MSVPLIFRSDDSGPGPFPAESLAKVLSSVYSKELNSSSAFAILDLNAGNYHNISLGDNVTQIQFTNANRGQRFILRITQHASSAKTVAWTDVDYNGSSGAATVRWAGGTVPVMSTSTSHTDVYGFLCTNDACLACFHDVLGGGVGNFDFPTCFLDDRRPNTTFNGT